KSINKNLKRYVGQGRFNDKRSLKGGSSSLRKKLVPVFLRAAEFGTMYFSAEREFTAFDSEFAD
ncbi:hypothetical protein KAI87_12430, partial [Myxococcota bacterium]|nr:hypothetical protein [Myxococcota bacterium]